ncbi:hypothetical protein KW800_01360 [Candidatus Parcubacteria bacterium]|nr:hypothetical protein [Candidatus Parcubacteria bacterium]
MPRKRSRNGTGGRRKKKEEVPPRPLHSFYVNQEKTDVWKECKRLMDEHDAEAIKRSRGGRPRKHAVEALLE